MRPKREVNPAAWWLHLPARSSGPTPTAAANYGSPSPWTSPRPSSCNRIWWILAAFFIIGPIAIPRGLRLRHRPSYAQRPGRPSCPPRVRPPSPPAKWRRPHVHSSPCASASASPARRPLRRRVPISDHLRNQRESDDRLQPERHQRQRHFQQDRAHRPLRKPDGVRRPELDHGRRRRLHRSLRLQQPDHLPHRFAEHRQVRRTATSSNRADPLDGQQPVDADEADDNDRGAQRVR